MSTDPVTLPFLPPCPPLYSLESVPFSLTPNVSGDSATLTLQAVIPSPESKSSSVTRVKSMHLVFYSLDKPEKFFANVVHVSIQQNIQTVHFMDKTQWGTWLILHDERVHTNKHDSANHVALPWQGCSSRSLESDHISVYLKLAISAKQLDDFKFRVMYQTESTWQAPCTKLDRVSSPPPPVSSLFGVFPQYYTFGLHQTHPISFKSNPKFEIPLQNCFNSCDVSLAGVMFLIPGANQVLKHGHLEMIEKQTGLTHVVSKFTNKYEACYMDKYMFGIPVSQMKSPINTCTLVPWLTNQAAPFGWNLAQFEFRLVLFIDTEDVPDQGCTLSIWPVTSRVSLGPVSGDSLPNSPNSPNSPKSPDSTNASPSLIDVATT